MPLKNIRTVLVILPALFLIACGSSSGSSSGGGGGGGPVVCTPHVPGALANSGTMDTFFSDQWHLKNDGINGASSGEDINVEPVWATRDGAGVRIAIVDDGLEITHEDLSANAVGCASYNYLDGTEDPSTGEHGTSVSGVAAAVGKNNVGVRGVAYAAELVGYNMIQSSAIADTIDALSRGMANNDIYNNSWGYGGYVGVLFSTSSTIKAAINSGVTTGRGGLGAIYVFAAGNSHGYDSSTPPGGRTDTNYSELTNNVDVITVAAVDDSGARAIYSQEGANILVAAPSGNFCDTNTTTTTDRTGILGYNTNGGGFENGLNTNYTQCFNGTSSATPVVSGVVALILEANPLLGWRDVRQILAETARKNDAADSDWAVNGAVLDVNHKYGFGVVDAQAAVAAAAGWPILGAQLTHNAGSSTFAGTVQDGTGNRVTTEQTPVYGTQPMDTITVTGSTVTTIETVAVTYTSDHASFGDLAIELESPDGTISRLANAHACRVDVAGIAQPQTPVACGAGYSGGWTFTSVRHLGETTVDGNWILRVKDGYAGDTDTASSWSLVITGR